VGTTVLSDDGDVVAWSTSGGAVLTASTVRRDIPPIVVVKPGGPPPRELAISGSGQFLAILNEAGTGISVYTLGASGDPQGITPPSSSRSIALSGDGTLLTAGMEDGTLVDYAKGPSWTRARQPWSVHLSAVAGVTYSIDDRFIVSFGSGGGGTDRSVAISNAFGRPDVRHLESRQADGSVSAISVGSDGDMGFGGNDGQVLLWSLPSARYLGQLTSGTGYTSSVLVDDKRRRIVTASGDGFIRSWTLDPARWVALACSKANRDWRPEEWRELLPDDAYVASCASQRPQLGKRDARRSR
jgi:WD40 repeat protein